MITLVRRLPIRLIALSLGSLLIASRADVVLDVRFDGFTDSDGSGGPTNNDFITGIVGGTGQIKGQNTVITATNPMGNGPYLSAVGGDAAQGGFFVPSGPANALSTLAPKFGTQRVLQGGFDIFLRSGVTVVAGASSNQLRIIDSDAGRQNNLRLIINNEGNSAFRVQLDNRDAAAANSPTASLILAAPPDFVIQANVTYHFGAIFENDGVGGNSVGYLFGIVGTGAIDTTNRTASNPAFLATSSINFDPDFGSLTSSGFSFGRLNSRSDGDSQEWDRLRLYNTAPTRFSAASENPPVVTFDLASGTAKIRFSTDLLVTYRVEKNDDLSNANGWTTLANNVAGTGVVVEVLDPGASAFTNRFYRVVVLPPASPSAVAARTLAPSSTSVSASQIKPTLGAVAAGMRRAPVAPPASAKPTPARPIPKRR